MFVYGFGRFRVHSGCGKVRAWESTALGFEALALCVSSFWFRV